MTEYVVVVFENIILFILKNCKHHYFGSKNYKVIRIEWEFNSSKNIILFSKHTKLSISRMYEDTNPL